jgi:hypothetical protein
MSMFEKLILSKGGGGASDGADETSCQDETLMVAFQVYCSG